MYNPFPGMNPYLEQPGLWPQVHNRLMVAIADEITPQVVPKYRVSIEKRIYTTTEVMSLVGVADVSVTHRREDEPIAQRTTTQVAVPRRGKVPLPVEVTERFLEVRLVQTNEVVCVIEVLSPSNKRSGEGRDAYETKRQKILGSATNLVEIDLLQGGIAMTLMDPTQKPYSILVSASVERPDAELYEFDLRTVIPTFPIPLQPRELVPTVNLQKVFNDVYDRARFDLVIDYEQPVRPKLSGEEATWIKSVLESLN